MIEFIRETFVSLLFLLIFGSILVYIIRLHLGNGDYQKFKLAQLIMRADGTLDRKAFKDTILFATSLYGFFFVLQKHDDLIISYFLTMAGVWLGYHVADNKLPTLGGPPKKGGSDVANP